MGHGFWLIDQTEEGFFARTACPEGSLGPKRFEGPPIQFHEDRQEIRPWLEKSLLRFKQRRFSNPSSRKEKEK
jgi:hypothetical protein